MSGDGIRMHGVDVTLRGHTILLGAGLEARPGEVTALVGANGSGKSTLLRTLFGAVPHRGEVSVHGRHVETLPARERVRLLSVLSQERDVAAGTRTREVVAVGRTARRRALEPLGVEDALHIERAMDQVRLLELAERDVATLSGGERQRTHIARVIAQDADVIVMDEPTNHLDIGHQISALELLWELAHGGGRTVLVALHDLTLAARWADRVGLLQQGAVVVAGPPQEVLTPERIQDCFGVRSRWIDVGGEDRLLLG